MRVFNKAWKELWWLPSCTTSHCPIDITIHDSHSMSIVYICVMEPCTHDGCCLVLYTETWSEGDPSQVLPRCGTSQDQQSSATWLWVVYVYIAKGKCKGHGMASGLCFMMMPPLHMHIRLTSFSCKCRVGLGRWEKLICNYILWLSERTVSCIMWCTLYLLHPWYY